MAAVPVRSSQTTAASRLRTAEILSIAILALSLIAAAGGLLIPGLYRDPDGVRYAMQGQDLLTLLVLPVLLVALIAARRGSTRATVLWLGLLGYLLYTYTGAAFAYAFNELVLVYIALFSLCVFGVFALGAAMDVAGIRECFDTGTPRKPVAAFLVLIALLLALPELGQIISALAAGNVPDIITRANAPASFVYALDLGIIAPLCVLAAVWLWRDRPWGYVLSGCMLIKAATMGLALISMTWFSVRAGLPLETGLTVIYAFIAAGGLLMSFWFLRHCPR